MAYNPPQNQHQENPLPRIKVPSLPGPEPFGKRLARLRQAAGFSQYSLARETGISQRMIAYYESRHGNPPLHAFHKLCTTLGVSADQLLGLEKVTNKNRPRDTSLWRRFNQVEKLPPKERKKIVDLLDAFLGKNQAG